MIVDEDLLNKIQRKFDLNLYESKLWTSLLSRGVSTAGELSDISDVPRSRSYDVLESLEKRGFVIKKTGKPIKYMAVDPSEVIDREKKNVKKESEQKVNKLEELKESSLLNELSSLHNQGVERIEPSELNGAVRGQHNIYNHIDSVLKEADENVRLMTTSTGLVRKVENFKDTLQEANKNGVDIKIAAPLDDEEAKQAAEEISDVADVKHTEDVKARFAVVDGEDVVFMVQDDQEIHPNYDVGVWANSSFFGDAMHKLYDNAWKDMENHNTKLD